MLHLALANRRFNLTITEICKLANITRPTFRARWRNLNEALKEYEVKLLEEFVLNLRRCKTDRDLLFTKLLHLIHKHKSYFLATIPNANYWLLQEVFEVLRPTLDGRMVSDKVYDVYIQHQIALISCWVKYEECAAQKIQFYVQKLLQTRLMDYGLSGEKLAK